jgi:hypothetical protein
LSLASDAILRKSRTATFPWPEISGRAISADLLGAPVANHGLVPASATFCNTRGVTPQRRAVEWTIAGVLLALSIFVPWLHDHWTTITVVFLGAITVVAFVRGKPEGIRFVVLSILIALLAVPLLILAFLVNVWLGLAVVILVPTSALVVTYRRDQRAVTN